MQLNSFCRKASGIVLLALAVTIHAEEDLRASFAGVRDLMFEALRSEKGEARGVLTGTVAQSLTRQFRGTSPITVEVTTLKRYRQPGCSRLNVLFRQEGVLLPDAPAPRTQTIEFGINYCLDGLPPASLE